MNQGLGGKLLIAATPLGNDADMSIRLRSALENVDIIAAEDTRRISELIKRCGIDTSARMISFYDHNERERTLELLAALQSGNTIVMVSDAGMPLISDPGYQLVQACIAHDINMTVLPGPSAVTTALALSGLPTEKFVFEGFAPRKTGARITWLNEITALGRTVVFFESPHRLLQCLEDICCVLGSEHHIVVCRELTKTHEEILRMKAAQMYEYFQINPVRGEITIVLAPYNAPRQTLDTLLPLMQEYIDAGEKPRQAAKRIAHDSGYAVKEIYDAFLRYQS